MREQSPTPKLGSHAAADPVGPEPAAEARAVPRLVVGAGSLGVGAVVILSGLSAFPEEGGPTSFLLPVLGIGLGIVFFQTAWRVLGE